MKNITLLLILPLLLTSCSITKNRATHKEATTTAITTHVDSVVHKVTDSLGYTRVKHSAGHRITERIDTVLDIPGSEMSKGLGIPDIGKSDTIAEGGNTVVITRTGNNKINVKSTVAPKKIVAQGQRETEDWNTGSEEMASHAITDETSHVIASTQVDSSRTTQSSVMSKESHIVGKWWLFGIAIVALLIVVIYKHFSR